MIVKNRAELRREGMNRLATIVLALAVSLGAGCGEDEPGLPETGTLFEYSRAGGIAFSLFELKIDADGTATVATTATAERAEAGAFELSESELGELRSILEETPISSLPDPGTPACADCFEHTYAYGGEEITLTDVSEPVPELADLKDFIDRLPIPEDAPNGG